jgi:CHAT domain-containing protein
VASQPLLAQYEAIERRLRESEASAARPRGRQSAQTFTAARAAIARLTISEHQLHQEILATSAEHSSVVPSPSLTLKALKDALPDRNAALVEYWTGERASYAWRITRTGIHSYRLPAVAQLERQCTAFREALLAVVSRDPQRSAEQRAAMQPEMEARWRTLGARLARTLFPSGMIPLSTSTVLIIGDGPIEATPFAALPSSFSVHGTTTPLRSVTFVNEPSATILSVLEAKSRSPRAMRLAIFTAEQSEQASIETPGKEPSALPFTGEESAKLREIFGNGATRSFSGPSITPGTLQHLDWSEFSIGHFAMHAVLNKKYAELTGLVLGEKRKAESADLLWYGDVSHLHTNLDLVVLSACNTSLGERLPGEGLRGLTQAFFASGSQRVLGTLWEVDDQATSQWMEHFYGELKKNRSPVKALHNAQEKMAADAQWSSPYYWAGFVLAGDWRPLP